MEGRLVGFCSFRSSPLRSCTGRVRHMPTPTRSRVFPYLRVSFAFPSCTMNLKLHEQLLTYLSTLVLPPDISSSNKASFLRIYSQYLVIGSFLYRKNRRDPNKP